MYKFLSENDVSVIDYQVYRYNNYSSSDIGNVDIKLLSGSLIDFDTTFNPNLATQNADDSYKRLVYDTIRQLYYETQSSHVGYIPGIDINSTTVIRRELADELRVISIPHLVFGEKIKPKSLILTTTLSEYTSSFNLLKNGQFDNWTGDVVDDWSTHALTSTHIYKTDNGINLSGNNIITPYITQNLEIFSSSQSISYDIYSISDDVLVLDPDWNLISIITTTGAYTQSFYSDNPGIYFWGSTAICNFEIGNITIKELASDITRTLIDDGHYNIYDISHSASFAYTSASQVGNIFYESGMLTLTNESYYSGFNGGFNLEFSGSQTIYELEAICNIEESEFNYPNNPTAFTDYSLGTYLPLFTDSGSYVGTNDDGELVTQSYSNLDFRPYITSLGLYNDKFDLVAVAKFPRGIPKENYLDMAFRVVVDL